jgi:AraC-like DNA-binding protein
MVDNKNHYQANPSETILCEVCMQGSTASRKQDVFSALPRFSLPYPSQTNFGPFGSGREDPAGEGLFFSPLPGFHFSACGPLRRDVPFRKELLCDVPVIVAILFLDGECRYAVKGKGGALFEMQRNMFLVGKWAAQEVEIGIPAQDGYSHVGFMVQDAALEEYFGRGMSAEVRGSLRAALDQGAAGTGTVAGIARPDVLVTARQILHMQQHGDREFLRCRCSVLDLFAKLFHSLAGMESRPVVFLQEQDRLRMAALKATIENDFRTISSATDICGGIDMSFSKANKVFKAIYSTTIAQYIHQCKMLYSYSALLQRDLNVSESAFAVGYSNISYFISTFKKHFGMTPKAVSRLKGKGAP